MRFLSILSTLLLTACFLLFGVSTASAFAVHMSARNAPSGPLQPGDTVTVDFFFDANQPDILLLSVAVLYDTSVLEYRETESAALPVIYPAPPASYGTTGAEPGYILYDPSTGMTVPFVELLPQQTPAWKTWPGQKPAGKSQVNFNYAEANITDTYNTRTTGTGIWIGSIVLRVKDTAPTGDSMVTLCNTCGGNVLATGTGVAIDPATVPLTGDFTITVPEPATLALGGAALVSLSLLYGIRLRRGTRQQRRRS